MPVYKTSPRNGESGLIEKYAIDPQLTGWECASRLLGLRKRFASERDEMLALQKEQAGREWAKFFKDEARDRLKLYRAACLLIPWVANEYPGDCKAQSAWDFPQELFGALDMVSGLATVGRPDG